MRTRLPTGRKTFKRIKMCNMNLHKKKHVILTLNKHIITTVLFYQLRYLESTQETPVKQIKELHLIENKSNIISAMPIL